MTLGVDEKEINYKNCEFSLLVAHFFIFNSVESTIFEVWSLLSLEQARHQPIPF
jgi:hypothetical protein